MVPPVGGPPLTAPPAARVPAMLHPFSPFGLRQPARAWAAVRTAGAVYDDPVTGMRLITGYRLCRTVLTDPAFSAASGQQQRARADDLPTSMLNTDGAEHRRLREAVSGAWSGRAVQRRSEILRQVAVRAAAELPVSDQVGFDLVEQFAKPFAVRALAAVLGLPDPDLDRFGALADAAAPSLDPLLRGPAVLAADQGSARLVEFLADRSRVARTDGAVTDLAGLAWDSPLSGSERAAYWSLLVVGGLEPLVAAVAGTIWMLLEHPSALRSVTEDPSLVTAAVNETLRLHSPIPFTARVCSTDFVDTDTDTDTDGDGAARVELSAGVPVLAVISAANRDPAVFADPDGFRIDRPRTPGHLAFGAGAHYCLGAPLVLAATGSAITALLQRYPVLAGAGSVQWTTGSVPRRLSSLPVSWSSTRTRPNGSRPVNPTWP